jgi:hypothetical protein
MLSQVVSLWPISLRSCYRASERPVAVLKSLAGRELRRLLARRHKGAFAGRDGFNNCEGGSCGHIDSIRSTIPAGDPF